MQEIIKQIKKLTIIDVWSSDHRKDKTPLIGKDKKPYWIVGLTTQEYGTEKLWGFLKYNGKDWKGQTKELEIWQEEYNGKMDWKFQIPTFKITKEMWDKVLSDIQALRQFITTAPNKTENAPEIEYPEANPEDIPFN